MARVTQRQVVQAARDQIAKRGGYTSSTYFQARGRSYHLSRPGEDVGACCAIGGVEQAIWKLTGEDVSSFRSRIAQAIRPRRLRSDDSRVKLYAGVMARLNAKARKMYPVLEGDEIDNIEHITFHASDRTSRLRVLNVMDAVLEDLSR